MDLASVRSRSPLLPLLFLLGAGCAGNISGDDDDSAVGALSVPTRVKVNGKTVDVETNYLPRVVQCENPNAPLEAMKAQAVAARTYLSYRAGGRKTPSILDGQQDQVYTCPANLNGRFVSDAAMQAVRDTVGQVVQVDGHLTAGFFVAGSSREAGTCRGLSDPTRTERFVTYNFGLTGHSIEVSSIGSSVNPDNRGCLGQRMANCLADANLYDYVALLRYFYGSDAQVAALGATMAAADAIAAQAEHDYMDATCFSSSLGRPVPLSSCVESAKDHLLYQCMSDGSFVLAGGTGTADAAQCPEIFALSP